MGVQQRKCQFCFKVSTAPCETQKQSEKCSRIRLANNKKIKQMKDIIGGFIIGFLFLFLLLSSSCSSSKVNYQKNRLFYKELRKKDIGLIHKYYEDNPNTTDTVIVQPWMGSELIKN